MSFDDKNMVHKYQPLNNPTKKDSIKKSKLAVIGSNPTIPQKELTEQMREVLEGVYHRGNTDGLNNVYREHNIGDSVEYSLDIVNQARVEELENIVKWHSYGAVPKHIIDDRIGELKGGDK